MIDRSNIVLQRETERAVEGQVEQVGLGLAFNPKISSLPFSL